MLLVVALVGLLAAVPLRGGDLRRLGDLHLRLVPLVPAALLVQVLVISVLPSSLPAALARALHLASYGLAGAFLVANRRLPGIEAIALGAGANVAAIAANGGVMPALPEALHVAGLRPEDGFANSAAVEGARLAFLGDVFAAPSWLPLANVFSVGDALLLVGVATLLSHVCVRRRRAPAGPVRAAGTAP